MTSKFSYFLIRSDNYPAPSELFTIWKSESEQQTAKEQIVLDLSFSRKFSQFSVFKELFDRDVNQM